MKTLILTGPESSGKSTIANYLSQALALTLIDEYSRTYLNKTKGKYDYKDLEIMAKQANNLIKAAKNENLILDTDLLTYKIWSQTKYGKTSKWVENELPNDQNRLYLLCYPDIEWTADPLRENPTNRAELFTKYEQLLIRLKLNYYIISGNEKVRMQAALDLATNYFF